MNQRIDLTGKRFGRWTVLSYAGASKWSCRCDCGAAREVDGSSLRRGHTNGCLACHPGLGNRRTHGESHTRLYRVWEAMHRRCSNPSDSAYARYGGRGISVDPAWTTFEPFAAWARMNGYAENLTIDRRDNDGDYGPGNCRWATHAAQNRNTSRNRAVEYQGRMVLVCDLALEVGLPQDVLKNRILRYGWPVDRAISTPIAPRTRRRA